MNGKLVCDCSAASLNHVKFMALYYDTVEIAKNYVITTDEKEGADYRIVRGVYDCISEEFESHLKVLIDEKIATYNIINDVRYAPYHKTSDYVQPTPYEKDIREQSDKILDMVGNKLYSINYINYDEKHMNVKIDADAKNILECYINKLKVGSNFDFEFLHNYFGNLAYYILMSFNNGESVVNTFNVLDKYFNGYFRQHMDDIVMNKKNLSNSMGIEALKIFVPNASALSFEEILELRHKLNDELICYRAFMSEMNEAIQKEVDPSVNSATIKYYIDTKINPAVIELKDKIVKSKYRITQDFLDEIKNPLSYSPFVASLFYNIPANIATMLSLGIIGSKIGAKFISEKIGLKQNGLYYLLKLNSEI